MSKSELALHNGSKVILKDFDTFNYYDEDELNAATNVIKSGVLSSFLADANDKFYGGKYVRMFEKDCEDFFKVRNAITLNSWTSGLIAAVGALEIEPGDEIITSTWTMSATAMAILHWNAIPVFADICNDTFNIDPISVKKNISKRTKAILTVDIFGQSSNIIELKKIADEHNLKIISDTAQSPGAIYNNKFAGTISDIGGFSLNSHKHIQTGEGGIIVTDNDELAERIKLIRNHGEAVVGKRKIKNINNIIGYNFRLGEIESSIGSVQLKKLNKIIERRQYLAQKLNDGLKHLKGLTTPFVEKNSTHVYYVYAMKVDSSKTGVHRDKIFDALLAEGVIINKNYMNVHLLPIFQNKIAYGLRGFPWNSEFCDRDIDYSRGICPVAEKLNDQEYLSIGLCRFKYTDEDISLIIKAFHKVWDNLKFLE